MEERQMTFLGDENGMLDDIDCLFHLMNRVEPPQALIKRILAQAQTPFDYSALPAARRLQPQVATGSLKLLVMRPIDERDGRQLRRKQC